MPGLTRSAILGAVLGPLVLFLLFSLLSPEEGRGIILSGSLCFGVPFGAALAIVWQRVFKQETDAKDE